MIAGVELKQCIPSAATSASLDPATHAAGFCGGAGAGRDGAGRRCAVCPARRLLSSGRDQLPRRLLPARHRLEGHCQGLSYLGRGNVMYWWCPVPVTLAAPAPGSTFPMFCAEPPCSLLVFLRGRYIVMRGEGDHTGARVELCRTVCHVRKGGGVKGKAGEVRGRRGNSTGPVSGRVYRHGSVVHGPAVGAGASVSLSSSGRSSGECGAGIWVGAGWGIGRRSIGPRPPPLWVAVEAWRVMEGGMAGALSAMAGLHGPVHAAYWRGRPWIPANNAP